MIPSLETNLNELYQTERNPQEQTLAARFAPVLCFDAREPFLPLAAGYTIFNTDGASQSMKRDIRLHTEGKPAAARAIEYAIWWDWDIHHLYELEHVWVYLDEQDQVVRVEGSWHGRFNELALQLEGERAVVLSEPGKHAFASTVQAFQERQKDYRRVETQFSGAHAHVLINEMFAGKIRQRVFDQTLARSYLLQQAFQPAWDYSQRFAFGPEQMVTWEALRSWIPRRVNTWLDYLEGSLPANQYRALHLAKVEGTLPGLQAAAQREPDAVMLPVYSLSNGKPGLNPEGGASGLPISLEDAFRFCRSEPMGAFLNLQEPDCIPALAEFMREKKLYQYAVVTAPQIDWLTRLRDLVPQTRIAVAMDLEQPDPLGLAKSCGASLILLKKEPGAQGMGPVNKAWVEQIHAAGLGVIGWPSQSIEEQQALEQMGLDGVWLPDADGEA